MARRSPRSARGQAGELARLRALAHPLRFRVFQEFAGHRRTTRQVAGILGQPPTRLYHHVNLLERVGLLRLVETRPNRGTVEKYFEAAPARLVRGRRPGDSAPAARRMQAALAAMVFDEARLELLAAMESRKGKPPAVHPEKEPTTVARTLLTGSPAQIVRLRRQLLTAIRRYAAGQRKSGGRPGGRGDEHCWSLTFAILPRRPAARSTEPGRIGNRGRAAPQADRGRSGS